MRMPRCRRARLPFIGEGENFRWVYDGEQDDILFTAIGGRCEETAFDEGQGLLTVPYSYSYEGDSDYVGLDCCTWPIESLRRGRSGSVRRFSSSTWTRLISFCSLSQQDDDFELPGQAYPEPGVGVMLMVGTLSIVGRRRSIQSSSVR